MERVIPSRRSGLVLTLDSWSPSIGRGHDTLPVDFCACSDLAECWECQTKTPAEREDDAKWAWRCGGHVCCTLYVFEHPVDLYAKASRRAEYARPENRAWPEPFYQARVSFWGVDDTGMERFFVYEEDARRFVCRLPVFLTKEWLFSCGFIFA